MRFLNVVVTILVLAVSSGAAVPPGEREALISLHAATNGENWNDSSGWLGAAGTECAWFGITCDAAGSHVVGINFEENNLAGTLPSALGNLISLEALVLERNDLTGSIPIALGSLQSLRYLDLSENDLSGGIPDSLGDLDALEVLVLFDNDLGGPIPAALGNLGNLVILNLSANRLTGSIPEELLELPALESLILGQFYDIGPRNNRLTGGIPAALTQLTGLRNLDLGFNQLGGTIPVELGGLTSLETLDLSANGLTGTIPAGLGNLVSLESLTLGFNSLSGAVPAGLGGLASLTGLDLQVNDLSGGIPHQFGNLENLRALYLNENNLTGTIPSELGNLENLQALYLHGNNLSGTLPDSFANLSQIRSLQVFGNDLEGPIPPWIGNLTNLTDLLLDGNRFTGTIPPQIGNLTNLTAFGAGGNLLSGEIPDEIGNLTAMQYLSLNRAGLSGEIPSTIWEMKELIDVRLEDNDLTGSLPEAIGELENLSVLLLSTNRLTGQVPATIGSLQSIQILGLDGNRLSGPIPAAISGAESLVFLGLEKNALNGDLPGSLLEMSQLQEVRFSFNALKTSDAEVLEFVNERTQGEPFEMTQTVPPTSVNVSEVTDRSAVVSWTTIPFDLYSGGYEIRVTAVGGGASIVTTTGSKRVGSHVVRGLAAETTYSVTARTTTHPFGFQQNFLRSEATTPVSLTTTEHQTAPALVDLVSGPSGLIQIGGAPQNEDSYVLGNFGDVATTIMLERVGDHFEQEPETFVLEPGATQTITIRSLPNQAPDSYWGYSVVTGDGVPDDFLIPVILLSTPPSVGTAVGEAVASRVDVFGREGTDGVGTVRFRNRGQASLQGVLVSDSTWIRTDPEPISIPPGEVRSVSFDVLRHRRPLQRGAVNGSVRLVYVAAAGAGKAAPTQQPQSTSVSTTLVTVVDTVVPEARSAVIPDLEAGEVRRLIPGVSHLVRPFGTFVTDLTVSNAFGASPLDDLEIFFDRTGSGDSSAASAESVAPTTSLVLANIVESVYGDDDGSGTIHVRASLQENLTVEASLSNVSGPVGEMRGTLPVFRTDRVIAPGQSSYLMGVKVAPDLETTLFIQEALGLDASVTVQFLRSSGEAIDSSELALERFELRELVGVMPAGTELVRIINHESSSGGVVSYALVINRETGSVETIVDWTSILGYPPGETVRIPIVLSEGELEVSGRLALRALEDSPRRRPVRRPDVPIGAAVRTSAFVMNPGAERSVMSVTFYESPGQVYRQRWSVEPGAMLTVDDLVEELKGSTSTTAGYVVVEMLSGESIVSAAVVRDGGGDQLVSTIPVVPDSSGLRLGQSVVYTGLDDSRADTVLARRPASFRTAFGMTETSGSGVTVRATVGFAGKSPLLSSTFSRDFTLAARETILIRDMLRGVLGEQRDTRLGDMSNVQLTLTVVAGEGAVTTFVHETENSSGDSRFTF